MCHPNSWVVKSHSNLKMRRALINVTPAIVPTALVSRLTMFFALPVLIRTAADRGGEESGVAELTIQSIAI